MKCVHMDHIACLFLFILGKACLFILILNTIRHYAFNFVLLISMQPILLLINLLEFQTSHDIKLSGKQKKILDWNYKKIYRGYSIVSGGGMAYKLQKAKFEVIPNGCINKQVTFFCYFLFFKRLFFKQQINLKYREDTYISN